MNSNENQKKGNTILLTVIAIATLLVAVVGATFAYFTATVTGNDKASSVIVKTAEIGTVTFTDGDELKLENALPGATFSKTFTISSSATSTMAVKYGVQLIDVTNSIGNDELEYTLKGTVQNSSDITGTLIAGTSGDSPQSKTISTTSGSTTTTIDLGTGTLGNKGEKHSYTLDIHFKETGSNQNSNQNQSFSGKIHVTTGDNGSETYYNNENSTGTNTMPSSES